MACMMPPFMTTHVFFSVAYFLFNADQSIVFCDKLLDLKTVATFAFSTTEMAPGENVIVPLIANSLEFTLSAPPPIHQFQESPLIVETDHLTLYPGKEAEEVLKLQGHEVTDIIGKEKWLQNDPEKYEGLIPQNVEWTEFIDEKTGEWVYLDEYGNRVEKP
jgi:heme/copper-type cytochrome/quinol oxidase subunit 1